MQNQGGAEHTSSTRVLLLPHLGRANEPFRCHHGNVTIENIFFGKTACCNSIVLGTTASGANCSSLVIRYNVLYNTPNPDVCASGQAACRCTGTSFPLRLCSNVSVRHNVFTPQRLDCGTAATTAHRHGEHAAVISGETPVAHLLTTDTCGVRSRDDRYPTTDMDGRPAGRTQTPDAGADEVG